MRLSVVLRESLGALKSSSSGESKSSMRQDGGGDADRGPARRQQRVQALSETGRSPAVTAPVEVGAAAMKVRAAAMVTAAVPAATVVTPTMPATAVVIAPVPAAAVPATAIIPAAAIESWRRHARAVSIPKVSGPAPPFGQDDPRIRVILGRRRHRMS